MIYSYYIYNHYNNIANKRTVRSRLDVKTWDRNKNVVYRKFYRRTDEHENKRKAFLADSLKNAVAGSAGADENNGYSHNF